ncbi:hypothetical protein V491_08231 [Pseudogymnoascus sp. VKM F-3775]|nr:hypothetical protein V491_08231 [Pseudogymnoascus sp. VKM F-3775]
MAIGSALMMFAQQLSGAIFVPIAKSIFQNWLVHNLSAVPGADIRDIVNVGATDLRISQMDSVLNAFNDALVATFFVVTVASGLALLPALTIEWLNVKVEKENASTEKIPMGDMRA